jgi:uncharacterized protein (DUF2384 family)
VRKVADERAYRAPRQAGPPVVRPLLGPPSRALGIARAMVARREAHNAGPNPNIAEGRLLAAMIEARDLAIKSLGSSHARKWLHDPAPTFDGQQPIHVLVARGPIPVRDLLMESWEGIY